MQTEVFYYFNGTTIQNFEYLVDLYGIMMLYDSSLQLIVPRTSALPQNCEDLIYFSSNGIATRTKSTDPTVLKRNYPMLLIEYTKTTN